MQAYDRIAAWYVETRDPRVGLEEVRDLMRRLAPGATVLDLGCGDGIPISQELVRAGFDVVALDASPEMVARYRANLPNVPARCVRVQEASFAPESLDAVVAWGVLFHLPADEQVTAVGKVATWLRAGGWFLFTAGNEEGVREDTMNGVAFTYTSLGIVGYRHALGRAGMHLVAHYHDAWDNAVYLARKAG
ncbi:MAG: putative methyltransferase [Rhodothermaceae bacterium]|nr:MAG: putative methyltransferase [Rhodothermaceae bacterium]